MIPLAALENLLDALRQVYSDLTVFECAVLDAPILAAEAALAEAGQ